MVNDTQNFNVNVESELSLSAGCSSNWVQNREQELHRKGSSHRWVQRCASKYYFHH